MTEPLARRSPSDTLSELQGQLSRELSLLDERRSEEPCLFRAYVQHAQVLAWRGVAEGRMAAPREAMECLDAVHSFVDRHLPNFSDPAAAAAVEIHYATQSLHLATQALEARRVEDRISDKRSEIERAILQVLVENRGRYLRRGEIHEALKLSEPPTPARVGQILVELHAENVVVRIHGRAQGNPNAAFYALSPRGLELCANLGLTEFDDYRLRDVAASTAEPIEKGIDSAARPPDNEKILQVARVALDPARNPAERRIARGLLASSCFGPMKSLVLWALSTVAREREEDEATQELANETLQEVLDARSVESLEAKRPGVLVSRREPRDSSRSLLPV